MEHPNSKKASLLPMNRKEFLKYSSLVAGGSMIYPAGAIHARSPQHHGDSNSNDGVHWYQQPLRILQTVLRETDAREYDANAVVAYMKEAGCDMLVVNAGGIVDFFQNPLPAANINPFMGDRDIVREITARCKEEGFRVIVRVDFRGVEEHIYRQHPDWFSVDHNGDPQMLTYTEPRLHSACYTGYYRTEHAEQFIRHLMENYDVDGIWHNSIGVVGICHCNRCRSSYREEFGTELPVQAESTDEELSRYMVWKEQVADRHMDHMRRTVKSYGDDKVYTAEVFTMFYGTRQVDLGIDLYNARDHFDFLVSVAFLTPNQEHITYDEITYANTIVTFLKSMAPEKEAIILYGGNGTAHRYVRDAPIDLNVWLWQALAAGGRFWNCNFTGMHPAATHDRRNAFNNTEPYFFVKKNEKLLEGHAPVQPIGIYYSKYTRQFYRIPPEEGDSFDGCIQGMRSVLVENHIPHGFIADDQVTAERLSRYKLLILPNVRAMSSPEIELIRAYVHNGGKLLATYASTLFDENGRQRNDFGLADVFGCRFTGDKINTRQDTYQYILQPDHEIVRPDSKKTELMVNSGYTLLCNPDETARVICTYTPQVHNQPPEKAWTDDWETEYPGLLAHSYGAGEVIYFANQPDQSNFEMGHPDLRNLLHRSIRYLVPDGIPVATNAPESVHIGLTRSHRDPSSFICSLVNTTSAPKRPLRTMTPVNDIDVSLSLEGRSLKRYNILRSQGRIAVDSSGNKVRFKLERLDDFCAVHLEMEQ